VVIFYRAVFSVRSIRLERFIAARAHNRPPEGGSDEKGCSQVAAEDSRLETIGTINTKSAAMICGRLLGHVEDRERPEILRKVGDETALHIMW
jgi:hypothetical protein